MARYCSPQLSVRTRLSPPYRATIRLKVFQGRNSISWAKSVLPVFIKASRDHPGSLRQLQIVDTALCPETRITPGVQSRRLSVNRTAVSSGSGLTADVMTMIGSELSNAGYHKMHIRSLLAWLSARLLRPPRSLRMAPVDPRQHGAE